MPSVLTQRPPSFPRLGSEARLFDLVAFSLPLLLAIQIQFQGRLFAAEILTLLLVPFVLLHAAELLRDMRVKTILSLAGLWLIFQITSDLVNKTPFEDYVRGWSKIMFLAVNFVVLTWIIAYRERRVWLSAAGLILSWPIAYVLNPPPLIGEFDWWKLFWVIPVSLAFAYLAAALNRSWYQATVVLTCALMNLALRGRAMAGISVAVCVIVLLSDQYRKKRIGEVGLRKLRYRALLFLSISPLIFLPAFSVLSMEGVFGEAERERSMVQIDTGQKYINLGSFGKFFGLLIGGRNEIIVSSKAIADAPVLGHGSWAKNITYIDLYASLGGRNVNEYRDYAAPLYEVGVIPTHSHFFGAWVDGGLGGAIFWAFVFFLIFAAAIKTYAAPRPISPLLLMIFSLQLWDIVFSPFGAERRFMTALFLVYACNVLKLRQPTPCAKTPHI